MDRIGNFLKNICGGGIFYGRTIEDRNEDLLRIFLKGLLKTGTGTFKEYFLRDILRTEICFFKNNF